MTWPDTFRPYERLASVAQVGGFRPPSTPRTSWIGQVLLGAPGETWPQNDGRPMHGLCQIRLDELPAAAPGPLDGVALLTLFTDLSDLPFHRPAGDGWELRTYSDVEALVPLVEPDGADEDWRPVPFPVVWRPRVEIPSDDDAPDGARDFYDDALFDAIDLDGLKVGGWPHTVQSNVSWSHGERRLADVEFVLQVDSDEKSRLMVADAGTIYIGWSVSQGWVFEWQCY